MASHVRATAHKLAACGEFASPRQTHTRSNAAALSSSRASIQRRQQPYLQWPSSSKKEAVALSISLFYVADWGKGEQHRAKVTQKNLRCVGANIIVTCIKPTRVQKINDFPRKRESNLFVSCRYIILLLYFSCNLEIKT